MDVASPTSSSAAVKAHVIAARDQLLQEFSAHFRRPFGLVASPRPAVAPTSEETEHVHGNDAIAAVSRFTVRKPSSSRVRHNEYHASETIGAADVLMRRGGLSAGLETDAEFQRYFPSVVLNGPSPSLPTHSPSPSSYWNERDAVMESYVLRFIDACNACHVPEEQVAEFALSMIRAMRDGIALYQEAHRRTEDLRDDTHFFQQLGSSGGMLAAIRDRSASSTVNSGRKPHTKKVESPKSSSTTTVTASPENQNGLRNDDAELSAVVSGVVVDSNSSQPTAAPVSLPRKISCTKAVSSSDAVNPTRRTTLAKTTMSAALHSSDSRRAPLATKCRIGATQSGDGQRLTASRSSMQKSASHAPTAARASTDAATDGATSAAVSTPKTGEKASWRWTKGSTCGRSPPLFGAAALAIGLVEESAASVRHSLPAPSPAERPASSLTSASDSGAHVRPVFSSASDAPRKVAIADSSTLPRRVPKIRPASAQAAQEHVSVTKVRGATFRGASRPSGATASEIGGVSAGAAARSVKGARGGDASARVVAERTVRTPMVPPGGLPLSPSAASPELSSPSSCAAMHPPDVSPISAATESSPLHDDDTVAPLRTVTTEEAGPSRFHSFVDESPLVVPHRRVRASAVPGVADAGGPEQEADESGGHGRRGLESELADAASRDTRHFARRGLSSVSTALDPHCVRRESAEEPQRRLTSPTLHDRGDVPHRGGLERVQMPQRPSDDGARAKGLIARVDDATITDDRRSPASGAAAAAAIHASALSLVDESTNTLASAANFPPPRSLGGPVPLPPVHQESVELETYLLESRLALASVKRWLQSRGGGARDVLTSRRSTDGVGRAAGAPLISPRSDGDVRLTSRNGAAAAAGPRSPTTVSPVRSSQSVSPSRSPLAWHRDDEKVGKPGQGHDGRGSRVRSSLHHLQMQSVDTYACVSSSDDDEEEDEW